MKITDRLIGDHKTFRKMMGTIDEIKETPPQSRDNKKLVRMVELFKDHLILHAWFEDQYYYPAVVDEIDRFVDGPISKTYINHLDREHKTIDGTLDRLESEVKNDSPVSSWPQTFSNFCSGPISHMKKEEEELFPESERVLGSDALVELSNEIERHRAEAPKVRIHTRS